MGCSVFYKPTFFDILQIVLWYSQCSRYRSEILEFISNINIDNPAKFRDDSMPKRCISKNRDFRNFGLPDMSKLPIGTNRC